MNIENMEQGDVVRAMARGELDKCAWLPADERQQLAELSGIDVIDAQARHVATAVVQAEREGHKYPYCVALGLARVMAVKINAEIGDCHDRSWLLTLTAQGMIRTMREAAQAMYGAEGVAAYDVMMRGFVETICTSAPISRPVAN